jgi:hypothetical protein
VGGSGDVVISEELLMVCIDETFDRLRGISGACPCCDRLREMLVELDGDEMHSIAQDL